MSRTAALPGIGSDGIERMRAARVLVLGAGGLGSPVLAYLAATGIGTIGIVDFDVVDLSNLQRQVIHCTASIGMLKTSSAARAIAGLTDAVTVVEHPVRLTRDNALALFAEYDVIVDGTDNFETRYLASDAAALLRKPYVWGSVLRFDGEVTVFWEGAPDGRSIDYRDLLPVPPAPGSVLSCAEAGVLGSVCGTIGTSMATEVVKIVTGVGTPLLGRVQVLDGLTGRWSEFELKRAADRVPVTGLVDYEAFCGTDVELVPTATVDDLTSGRFRLLDVREAVERERDRLEGDEWIPLAELLADPAVGGTGPVIVYCASGIRSETAVRALRAAGVDARSLRGGITAVRAAAVL